MLFSLSNQFSDGQIDKHMRSKDIQAFRDAANSFGVHILVRRTNPASIYYIGRKGYMPKRIDCKPKTADKDVFIQKNGLISRVSGLVVNPTLPGFKTAFNSVEKYNDACEQWRKFSTKHCINMHGETAVFTNFNQGGFYTVQMNPESQHYGCLRFCPVNYNASTGGAVVESYQEESMMYIHGDYDLYGLVPEEAPEFKSFQSGTLWNENHFMSREFGQVQSYINNRIGTPMIQHGAQEHLTHQDDHIDVFWADGHISDAKGRAAIEQLYRQGFNGRETGPGEQIHPKGKFGTTRVN